MITIEIKVGDLKLSETIKNSELGIKNNMRICEREERLKGYLDGLLEGLQADKVDVYFWVA
jgi:hypothetical protein